MKLTKSLLIAAIACLTSSVAFAQSYYDDDIYFDASKAKKESKEVKVNAPRVKTKTQSKTQYVTTSDGTVYIVDENGNAYPTTVANVPGSDLYTVYTDNTRDVDEYNRRYQDDAAQPADSFYRDSFANTRNIERFSNPDIVYGSGDNDLITYYEAAQPSTTVNLILADSYYPYSTYLHRYYDPWYSWYSPFYSLYSPYYYVGWGPSWSWSWAWGPSWSWGWDPYWGPSWSWGWGHHYHPSWAYYPPRPSTPSGSYRPHGSTGSNSYANHGGYRGNYGNNGNNGGGRPGVNALPGTGTNGGYRGGTRPSGSTGTNIGTRPSANYNGGTRPMQGSIGTVVDSRPTNSRPTTGGTYGGGRAGNVSNGTNYNSGSSNRANSSNSGYRSNSSSSSSRSSFSGGGSSSGSRGGGGGGSHSSGGGRSGRH